MGVMFTASRSGSMCTGRMAVMLKGGSETWVKVRLAVSRIRRVMQG